MSNGYAFGRPCLKVPERTVIRFTPTCVGTIGRSANWRPTTAVHPHVRGDNPTSTQLSGELLGSPPRAWGQ